MLLEKISTLSKKPSGKQMVKLKPKSFLLLSIKKTFKLERDIAKISKLDSGKEKDILKDVLILPTV